MNDNEKSNCWFGSMDGSKVRQPHIVGLRPHSGAELAFESWAALHKAEPNVDKLCRGYTWNKIILK